MSAGRESAGFTLVEVLVAMTLLGLVSLALTGSLRLGGRAWDATEAAVAASGEVRAAQQLLRRAIEQAQPLLVSLSDGSSAVAFGGDRNGLGLVAPMPGHVGFGAFDSLRFEVVEDLGRRDLVAVWDRFGPAGAAWAPSPSARRIVLLKGIAELRAVYFGSEQPDAPPAWREVWTARPTLPALVGVEVRFPSGDARRWPAFVARPMVDVAAVPRPAQR